MAHNPIRIKRSLIKKGTNVVRLQSKRFDIEIVVSKVGDEVQNRGFRIFPSTRQTIVHVIARGVSRGVIENAEDATISAAALMAAGVQEASEQGTVRVRSKHILRGWRERLATTGGNCPPHRCMKRSILMRVSMLRAELPGFDDLVDSTLDKIDV